MILLLTSAVASLGFNLVSAAFPSGSAQEPWHAEPPMHYARAAHAVVSDGKFVYALAGMGAGGAPILVFERFDGHDWRDEGRIPGPGLNAPAAVALNGKIYPLSAWLGRAST